MIKETENTPFTNICEENMPVLLLSANRINSLFYIVSFHFIANTILSLLVYCKFNLEKINVHNHNTVNVVFVFN